MKTYTAKLNSGIIIRAKSKKELCSRLKISLEMLDSCMSNKTLLPKNIMNIYCVGEKDEIFKRQQRRCTPYGRAQEMWTNIKFRLKNNPHYKGVSLNMTRAQFIIWAMPMLEKALDVNMKAPSVDRIDPYKGYEIGNIKILPKSENCKKQFTDKPFLREVNRAASKRKFSKKVLLVSDNGTEKVYDSAADVDRYYNQYLGYTHYRINGQRPMPKNWKEVGFLNE